MINVKRNTLVKCTGTGLKGNKSNIGRKILCQKQCRIGRRSGLKYNLIGVHMFIYLLCE